MWTWLVESLVQSLVKLKCLKSSIHSRWPCCWTEPHWVCSGLEHLFCLAQVLLRQQGWAKRQAWANFAPRYSRQKTSSIGTHQQFFSWNFISREHQLKAQFSPIEEPRQPFVHLCHFGGPFYSKVITPSLKSWV